MLYAVLDPFVSPESSVTFSGRVSRFCLHLQMHEAARLIRLSSSVAIGLASTLAWALFLGAHTIIIAMVIGFCAPCSLRTALGTTLVNLLTFPFIWAYRPLGNQPRHVWQADFFRRALQPSGVLSDMEAGAGIDGDRLAVYSHYKRDEHLRYRL